MADKLHEQQDTMAEKLQRRDDESPADHDPVTQIEEHEILNLPKTKISVPEPLISESSMPTESVDDESSMSTESVDDDNIVISEITVLDSISCAATAMACPSFQEDSEPTNMDDHVFGRDIIIVTPDSLQLTKYTNRMKVEEERLKVEEERFPEEAAVCKFCFKKFETQNMFMTKCICPKPLLIHKECIPKSAMNGNNECNVCEQEVMSFAVKWRLESIKSDIMTSTPKQGKRNRLLKRFGFKSSN